MKSSRQLSIVVYGIIVTVVGLVLYVGLTVLATKQLDILRVSHEEKRLISAKAELKKATGNLMAATEKLVEKFYNWEELLQQINDPTYYTYWRENRVAFVNFVPSYFMKISLFDKDRRPLISAGRGKIKHSFDKELEQIIIRTSVKRPIMERCRAIIEVYGAKNILGYFCVELDLYQGLKAVQTFSYLDIDSVTIHGLVDEEIVLGDLIDNIVFSVQSEQMLSKMQELTVGTIFRYLVISAGVILVFLYILLVPLGRQLRGLSAYINALQVSGARNSPTPLPGFFSITELDTVYRSLSDYQKRLEESAAELKKSEEHFRSLIENSSDVIMSLNANGVITYISPSVVGMLGYQVLEIVGNCLFWYIHSDDIEVVRLSMNIPDTMYGKLNSNEFKFKHKNGEWLSLEFSGEKYSDDSGSYILNCRDITDRKKAQEAIAIARDKALEASEAKSNFLANTSHELRTPLNAILGYSEIIIEDLKNNNNKYIKNDIDKVHVAASNLLNLIDKVLDLSKIESGKMELSVEAFSVRMLLGEIEHTISPLMDKNVNSLQIRVDEAVDEMYSDKNKLRQIICNLLNNAAKFTHNGTVMFDVMRRRENGCDCTDFIVSDTGIGMSTEQQDKVFEPFAQADASTTRQYGGTGLGLSICRNFAHIMNGNIDVQSKEGVGSTFTLTLPTRIRSSVERFPPRKAG